MRGEKLLLSSLALKCTGSSPHARGKVRALQQKEKDFRIIPACAGKRVSDDGKESIIQDHPRMRGEKEGGVMPGTHAIGSSPHARGKALDVALYSSSVRIIPACAGKRNSSLG